MISSEVDLKSAPCSKKELNLAMDTQAVRGSVGLEMAPFLWVDIGSNEQASIMPDRINNSLRK